MKAAVLLMVLCAALAVRSASLKVPDAKTFCGVTGAKKAGGWTVVDTEDDATLYETVPLVDDYLTLAAEEYIASSNGTFPCPDEFDTDYIRVCTQVVSGMKYKILFSAYCIDVDIEDSYVLSAELYAPAGSEDSTTTQVNSVELVWEGSYDELDSTLYPDE